MTALIVLGTTVAALVLVGFIRVGATAEYSAEGLTVRMKIGGLRVTVFPVKRKPAKEKKQKEKQAVKPPEAPPAKPGGSLAAARQLLPVIADAAGRLRRKLRVECVHLDITVAAQDPAAVAVAYGGANAAIGMLWPLLENNFDIKQRRIRTAADFNAQSPTVYLYAAASLTIGQAVALGLHLAVSARKFTSQTKKKKEKEAI